VAIRKIGSRRLVVDGVTYLWRVRQRPTYDQGLARSPLSFCVQHASTPGTVLIVELYRPRPDNWTGKATWPLSPSEVADLVHRALAKGWHPEFEGPQFKLVVDA
jgi:hypothetical protein